MTVPQMLGLIVLMLGSAKVLGVLARRIGQPAVLGELVAGVILGSSVLGLVNPKNEVLHLFGELGVIILLFEIGLETDIGKLLRVGGASAAVAIVGVVLPFALGYVVCAILRLDGLVGVVAGATLTATSVGITARVLSDLGRLQTSEGRIIVGAAVIDDVVGLIILAIVEGITRGQGMTPTSVSRTAATAVGFLIVTFFIGRLVLPALVTRIARLNVPGIATFLAIMLAFGLAWLASVAGSAVIMGAFVAGLLLRETTLAREMEEGVTHLGHFFVPLFFVCVGAAVDIRMLNPADSANRQILLIASLLIAVAIAGKFAAGYAPFWFKGNKAAIGVGMIPRGEVGLIFAQMGLAGGVFDRGLFTAVTLMVMATTFIAPPLLGLLMAASPKSTGPQPGKGLEELVSDG